MVWGIFPVDPLPGEDTYYIFAKGTYKVGRKGCDVIINKDKGVSRVHAEIILDAMTSLNPSSNNSSRVRIRDCSKYGTFVYKNFGSKEKIHELPNKETTMNDGDLVSFGTGNATYRFCFVPIVLFVICQEPIQVNHHLLDKVSLIGASTTIDLSPGCTHVLVDQFMSVKEDLIDAIVAKKPFALSSWIEVLAEKGIRTEIPSCSSYAPTLTLEGMSVRVADPKSRESCLKGYKFLMDSSHAYMFGDRLLSFLEVAGATVLSIEGFCSTSQGSDEGKNNAVVCVIPGGSANKVDRFNKLGLLSRVKEADLVCAVITGHLVPSIMMSPSVLISSSCSTDETVVADSDEEAETATSNHATGVVSVQEATEYERKVGVISDHAGTRSENIHIMSFQAKQIGRMDKVDKSESENIQIMSFQDKNVGRMDKADGSESENIDVIYSQDLIVRNINLPATISSTMNTGVQNFKRFRKINTQSGNSFNSLIPYSKYPYQDSDWK